MMSSRILIVTLLALGVVSAGAEARTPVTRCDRIAANPDDLERVTPGVYWTVLDGHAARDACAEALESHADEPRLIYQYGRALARLDRFDEAVSYLSRAADEGHVIAYTTLGSIFLEVIRNYAGAASWFRQGAALGSASAQVHLGDMYFDGQGFDRDDGRAATWYRRAALQGYALGQSKLAWMYEWGRGVTRDLEQASQWYRKAAADGLPRAQYALGRLSTEPGERAGWMRKAADQGYGDAMLALAQMLRDGNGVDPSRRDAYYWYVIASRHREEEVRKSAEIGMRDMCREKQAAAGEATAAWCCIE